MKDLTTFSYQSTKIRVFEVEGEPWFVAKDAGDILGLSDIRTSLRGIDEEDRRTMPVTDSLNRERNTTVINESALYQLIFQSRKSEAQLFKRWITHEVIPSIRKTGKYEVAPIDPQKLIAQAVIEAHKLLAEQKPKVEFYDAVTGSQDAITIAKASKVLNLGIGRNKLFLFLRNMEVLRHDNEPYQKFIDLGWFRVIEHCYQDSEGWPHVRLQTLVYQKGLDGIRKLWEGVRT